MQNEKINSGRGAQLNTPNKYSSERHELRSDFLEYCSNQGENIQVKKTKYVSVYPKTIVNKVNSPDVGLSYSLNPYQGCEHGCTYCYARNTHEYWGYSAGIDFEQQILVKAQAHLLLELFLKRRAWLPKPIVLSGNTDCYQPAERRFKLTRKCLEVFLKYKHPVGIITKNSLILRDLDLLKKLAEFNLIIVNISITTLNDKLRRVMEPRTASISKRFDLIKTLSENGIPVRVMMAPVIPGINSQEILPLARKAADYGALDIGHTLVRLNGSVALVFEDWIRKVMPDKAEKVLNQIKQCHGGKVQDSRFGIRMRGEGTLAEHLNNVMKLSKTKYFKKRVIPELSIEEFNPYPTGQLRLFQ